MNIDWWTKVILEKISVDFKPTPRLMSQSCFEVEVSNEAIEKIVISPTFNEVFQQK